MKKARFAVVGVGGLGNAHIKGILNNKDIAELVYVCDNREEVAKMRSEEYGVPYFVDFYEMLKVGGFDCVILVTPDQIHREHAVAAMEAGYHVLCEKPLAQTMDDCIAMVETARRTGMKFMTGQVCRKAPRFIKAKELVDEGVIGDLFYVESEYAHDYQFLKPLWRKDPVNLRYSIIGGGCHALDLLRWIAGNPTKVSALANRKVLTDWPVDDCTVAIMQFPNGVIGKVFCGIGVKRDYTMRTCLYGTKGTIIVYGEGGNAKYSKLKLYRHAVTDNGKHIYPDEEITVEMKSHNVTWEIEEMAKAIINDTPIECDAVEGSNTVAVGLACVMSAARGGEMVEPPYVK